MQAIIPPLPSDILIQALSWVKGPVHEAAATFRKIRLVCKQWRDNISPQGQIEWINRHRPPIAGFFVHNRNFQEFILRSLPRLTHANFCPGHNHEKTVVPCLDKFVVLKSLFLHKPTRPIILKLSNFALEYLSIDLFPDAFLSMQLTKCKKLTLISPSKIITLPKTPVLEKLHLSQTNTLITLLPLPLTLTVLKIEYCDQLKFPPIAHLPLKKLTHKSEHSIVIPKLPHTLKIGEFTSRYPIYAVYKFPDQMTELSLYSDTVYCTEKLPSCAINREGAVSIIAVDRLLQMVETLSILNLPGK